jgi:hypothetical protein
MTSGTASAAASESVKVSVKQYLPSLPFGDVSVTGTIGVGGSVSAGKNERQGNGEKGIFGGKETSGSSCCMGPGSPSETTFMSAGISASLGGSGKASVSLFGYEQSLSVSAQVCGRTTPTIANSCAGRIVEAPVKLYGAFCVGASGDANIAFGSDARKMKICPVTSYWDALCYEFTPCYVVPGSEESACPK